ncbi:nucleotide-diphosphate-sugar epimerase [Alishewanella longhuensis]|uniref:Nucleotide-diphosphate-sugar epimerase n=1 Tax=Alishewanella longhuensis TaxID=1091037 RepID=A0ABQ3L6K2_9ALTE|nr:NmrA family NAD(P)-binding protein [Alishewanella longhuensis]GHG77667.1 nucleotide-diphosphate-sugar epimerase [Alishewanella longhuensis]
MSGTKKIIVVLGASGQQGKGVVNAIKSTTDFNVRALSRRPESYQGQADQVVFADLNNPDSLAAAFAGAHGVFAVTNFWEPGTDEITQAKNAIAAAKAAGVEHFIWSTLPNVNTISSGRYDVPHFSNKAVVDQLVTAAGFKHHSFVVATFFYQNLLNNLAPTTQSDGAAGWALPIARASKSIHMADINDLGAAVAGAFANPAMAGQGQYLPVVGELLSFDDIITELAHQGKHYSYQEVPAEVFAGFFPGAAELAQMFGYFQEYTYLGTKIGKADIELEQQIAGRTPTRFAAWAADNL